MTVQSLGVSDDAGIDRALATMTTDPSHGLLVVHDPLVLGAAERIGAHAARQRLAASFPFRRFVDAGGLFSYGVTVEAIQERMVAYVARILRGAKPADLPFTQIDRFDLVINRGAARELGITVPRSLLLQATEILE